MKVKLLNEKLLIDIDTLGAELKSIKKGNSDTEYLWQGDKNSWSGSSPILFPIIGALNDDKYELDSKTFYMNQHGFARKTDFTIVEQSTNKVLFSITNSHESLEIYPFKFELILGYELIENKVVVSYEVKNIDDKTVSFQIGGHPGFNCPLNSDLDFTDYKLVLNKDENSERRFKNSKVLSGIKEKFFFNNNVINLKHELFKDGALIFDDLKSNTISLESDKDDKKVIMDFTGFPYFGIWSWPPEPQNYVCLEPWYGVDSTIGDDPSWNKKEGLVHIEKDGTFKAFYTIEII